MPLDWYPWHARDYRKDTLHLSLKEDGAYRRLIDEYMLSEAPLPDNDVALARIAGVTLAEWLEVAAIVKAFFRAEQGVLTHKRCEEELHAQALLVQNKSKRGKDAADARWQKHREGKGLFPDAVQTHSASTAPAIRNGATRQDKTTFLSSGDRKSLTPGRTSTEESAEGRSLATALPAGALASATETQPPSPAPPKRPSEMTKADLELHFATRRAAQPAKTGMAG